MHLAFAAAVLLEEIPATAPFFGRGRKFENDFANVKIVSEGGSLEMEAKFAALPAPKSVWLPQRLQ